jgi:uncharacterized protein (TIGR03437 family)
MRFKAPLLGVILFFCPGRHCLGQCPYRTVAGPAVTFVGEGIPAARSLFFSPQALASATDGSIYVADTGNHRVRRIGADGIVRTIAGTGEQGFSGDGGAATAAVLNGPAGIALAPDGSIYISDTGNHRVRRVDPDGVIQTVAGNGRPRFGGDGEAATAASLNLPTSVALDVDGNLLILDSWNNRVRRVEADGTIRTIAGTEGRNDYEVGIEKTGALTRPYGLQTSPEGEIYVSDVYAIWRIAPDGSMQEAVPIQPLSTRDLDQIVRDPTPLADLKISRGTLLPGSGGRLLLAARYQLFEVSNGTATPQAQIGDRSMEYVDVATDPSTDGVVLLRAGSPNELMRQPLDGAPVRIYRRPEERDPAKVTSALELSVDQLTALAAGPDQTIYIGEYYSVDGSGRVLALGKDDRVRTIISGRVPLALAVDSKSTIYVAYSSEIVRLHPGGADETVLTRVSGRLSLGVDGQDRLYVLQSTGGGPGITSVMRLNADGSRDTIISDRSFNPNFNLFSSGAGPMAVAPDGTVYLFFSKGLTTPLTSLLKVPADAPGTYTFVDSERRIGAQALAITGGGNLYLLGRRGVSKLLPDGVVAPVFGSDNNGFRGENGFDSAPNPASDFVAMAWDGKDGLLVAEARANVRMIALDSCDVAPGPYIGLVAESATENTNLRLVGGQLVSIHGFRLGPADAMKLEFDSSGHYPFQAGGTEVTINGVAAPLLSVGADQIDAVVPFALDGQGPARISVTHDGRRSEDALGRIAYYGPAILNMAMLGTPERRAIMINEDGSMNGPSHPAKLGSVVTIFATGTGELNPAGEDGARAGPVPKKQVLPVTIRVQGQEASVLSAGSTPGMVEGITQINLRLPSAIPGLGGNLAFIRIEMGLGIRGAQDIPFYFMP